VKLRELRPLSQAQSLDLAKQRALVAFGLRRKDVAQAAQLREDRCYFNTLMPPTLPLNEHEASRPVYVPVMPPFSDMRPVNLISPATPPWQL
jgi:hypothetical protein